MVTVCTGYKHGDLSDKYPTKGPAEHVSSQRVQHLWQVSKSTEQSWTHLIFWLLMSVGSVPCHVCLGRSSISISYEQEQHTHAAMKHLNGWSVEEESRRQNRAVKNSLWQWKQADLYIQPGTNRSVAAADIKQDVHLLWEKTEAWLPSLAQRLPTMVNWQGRPPPPQGCEALVLFCPNQFAEHRKLIPHPQSNSFLSIPLHAVPGSTSCPRAASQQGLGLWGSGEGWRRKTPFQQSLLLFQQNEIWAAQWKSQQKSFISHPLPPTLTWSAKGAGSLEGIYSDTAKSLENMRSQKCRYCRRLWTRQEWRNVQHSVCQHLHSQNAFKIPWLKASRSGNKPGSLIVALNFLHYLLTIDIYAGARRTTAILLSIGHLLYCRLHCTCCFVASTNPPLLPKPTCELAVEGKEELLSVCWMSSFAVLFLWLSA